MPDKVRHVRVPQDLWDEAMSIATFRRESLSEVIRAALVAYVKRYKRELES